MTKPITKKQNKKVYLVFTRDFDQWVQEMVRNSLVIDAPKIWGKGISDQIVHFTGRTFEWYRYQSDMNDLKKYLIARPISANIFQKKYHLKFLNTVKQIRKLISVNPKKIDSSAKHLANLSRLFRDMYPAYPLGIFIAGPWREDFLKIHNEKGEKILQLLFNSRKQSEGLLKEVGNYLRGWLSPILVGCGYPAEFVRLLTVQEVNKLVTTGKIPSLKELNMRAKGYIYSKGKILNQTGFKNFLKKKNLELTTNTSTRTNEQGLRGSTAFKGKIVIGRVKIVLNSFEADSLKKGSILVTPMTSPEYLPAMKTAKAIVTDEGGITCHAAITARELKKPCVIGTKIATKVLKDGDLVEVDANAGIVKLIKK